MYRDLFGTHDKINGWRFKGKDRACPVSTTLNINFEIQNERHHFFNDTVYFNFVAIIFDG